MLLRLGRIDRRASHRAIMVETPGAGLVSPGSAGRRWRMQLRKQILSIAVVLLAAGALSSAFPRNEPPSTPPSASSTVSKPESNSSEEENVKEETALYANAHPYMDDSVPEIEQRVPELRGLKPDPDPEPGEDSSRTAVEDRERLLRLLEEVGVNVDRLVEKIPNLIADEEVTQAESVSGAENGDCASLNQGRGKAPALGASMAQCGGSVGQETRQTFHYLILVRQTPEGRLLDEDRTDRQNRPLGQNAPNFRGFVESWVAFAPGNLSQARFRYLGEQKIHGRRAYVIAFAQIPGAVRLPGEIRAQGRTLPMLFQGIAWIDQANFEILELRTDLLAPQLEVQLLRQTAEIRFGPVRIPQLGIVLWLPQRVDVRCEANGLVLREQHAYSKYHMYQATTRMILPPAS